MNYRNKYKKYKNKYNKLKLQLGSSLVENIELIINNFKFIESNKLYDSQNSLNFILDIALDSVNNNIYVLHTLPNRISKISLLDNTIIKEILLESGIDTIEPYSITLYNNFILFNNDSHLYFYNLDLVEIYKYNLIDNGKLILTTNPNDDIDIDDYESRIDIFSITSIDINNKFLLLTNKYFNEIIVIKYNINIDENINSMNNNIESINSIKGNDDNELYLPKKCKFINDDIILILDYYGLFFYNIKGDFLSKFSLDMINDELVIYHDFDILNRNSILLSTNKGLYNIIIQNDDDKIYLNFKKINILNDIYLKIDRSCISDNCLKNMETEIKSIKIGIIDDITKIFFSLNQLIIIGEINVPN